MVTDKMNKMEKKLILSFMVIAFLLVLSSSVLASVLDISMEQDPYPVKAGENLKLNFSIENTGSENLTDVIFDLDTDDPLTLKSNSEQPLDLNAGQTKTIAYTIFVESDAQDGKETVTLNYEIDGRNYDEDFDVLIAPDQVYLEITSVSSNPEKVAPGGSLDLSLALKNTASSEVRNVIIKLDISNLPFAPESVTEQRIDLINDEDAAQVNFNLIALSTADIQVYKVPLSITYTDSFGNEYTRQDLVSIDVFEKPSIDATLEKDTLIQNMASKLDIQVLNKGLGKITFVEAKLMPSQDYDIEGSNYQYIGNIESDDYSSIEFNIIPKKSNFNVLLQLDYRDSNNQKYSEVKTINVEAYSVAEAQRLGLLPTFPWLIVLIILVVIALIIFFVVRRNRKKKKKMQNQE
jgi:hypothetical protein